MMHPPRTYLSPEGRQLAGQLIDHLLASCDNPESYLRAIEWNEDQFHSLYARLQTIAIGRWAAWHEWDEQSEWEIEQSTILEAIRAILLDHRRTCDQQIEHQYDRIDQELWQLVNPDSPA